MIIISKAGNNPPNFPATVATSVSVFLEFSFRGTRASGLFANKAPSGGYPDLDRPRIVSGGSFPDVDYRASVEPEVELVGLILETFWANKYPE